MIKSILQSAIRPFARSMILPVEKLAVLPVNNLVDARRIHLTSNVEKDLKVGREKFRIKQAKSSTVAGEDSSEMPLVPGTIKLFPDATTATTLFNNVPYNRLHIVNIKVTMNNTIMTVTDYRGVVMILHSAGCEGFKNSRRGTNVAAQQTAYIVGQRALDEGIKTVRVRIQGLGAGRAGALKGIQLSGLKVASLTDDTRVSWNPPRPRKQRRI
ncbi:mitochondrial ribosomal protein S11 [Megachile rotundata]|uniref:mitochondrial ribosomal protein S11 n=1 Tax=Megachile rotundata TaxID=143995 RepID=UPI0006151F8E|nr:PREDICTED: 30S ribosomal protein S11, chloroplastic [Megachile rotundata]